MAFVWKTASYDVEPSAPSVETTLNVQIRSTNKEFDGFDVHCASNFDGFDVHLDDIYGGILPGELLSGAVGGVWAMYPIWEKLRAIQLSEIIYNLRRLIRPLDHPIVWEGALSCVSASARRESKHKNVA